MMGKPAPHMFLNATEALGVKAEECIGVEDAEAGIKAIKAAGMFVVGVGAMDKTHAADIIFKSPEELDLYKIIEAYELWRI